MLFRSRRSHGIGVVCPVARMSRARILLLAAAAAAPALHAQTIVPNPNLDTELPPWAAFVSAAPDPIGGGGAPTWVPRPDLNGSTLSGSALIDFAVAGAAANTASGMAQCFEFSHPTLVNFVNYGMSFHVPATTIGDGSLSATVEIRLFSGSGCSGFISGGSQGQVLGAGLSEALWYTLGDHRFVPTGAPVTAASAQIRGYLRQTTAAPTQSDYRVHLDHFVVVLNSTTPVELMQFDVE